MVEWPWLIVAGLVCGFIGYQIARDDARTRARVDDIGRVMDEADLRLAQARRNAEFWRDRQAAGYLSPERDYEWILRDLETVAGAAK